MGLPIGFYQMAFCVDKGIFSVDEILNIFFLNSKFTRLLAINLFHETVLLFPDSVMYDKPTARKKTPKAINK